jgi:hypothetical protein
MSSSATSSTASSPFHLSDQGAARAVFRDAAGKEIAAVGLPEIPLFSIGDSVFFVRASSITTVAMPASESARAPLSAEQLASLRFVDVYGGPRAPVRRFAYAAGAFALESAASTHQAALLSAE